ncbi:hypothetical protein [Leucothrix arctica]|uniref:WGR domain-containing protein n=1 Tax=Leucothrix arctica TaxID=1481894 RepID=A0A317C4R4_9GAMM|nr:hypothetical protein [Leucothrix arctica]PWQ93568.1 hypothetical protein DKT75_18285 [Leucothrix arctica]
MKKINFSNLSFQEGKSDKVYEVDLIEQMSRESERYFVNFRYGHRGANLREGTKTTQPVSLEQAEQLFASVVVSKMNKGYVVTSGDNPLEDAQSEVTDSIAIDPADISKHQQTVYQRFLESRDNKSEEGRCNRLIWRLGELEMASAVPALLDTLHKTKLKEVIRTYSLIWSLGRCKDSAAFETVNNIAQSNEYALHIRRMALQAAWHLSPPTEQAGFLEECFKQVPTSLQTLSDASALLAWAQEHKSKKYRTKDQSDFWFVCLYLKAKSDPSLRQSLLELCRIAPLEFGSTWLIRLFFKVAEFELDAELLAVLTMRIETSSKRYYDWNTSRYENQTWQHSGREYFRLRSWRLLRRLGELNNPNYVPVAAALLQQYDDDNSQIRSIKKYSWDGGYRTETFKLPRFSGHIAFQHALNLNSENCRPMPSGKYWYKKTDTEETKRVEAFPHLWDQQPAAFIDCLARSRSAEVHHFALRGLADHPAVLPMVSVNDWVRVLCSAFSASVVFARTQLEKYHSAALTNMDVLRKITRAQTLEARTYAHELLARVPDNQLLNNVDWHVDLITSVYADNREQAKGYHNRYPHAGEKQQLLLGKLVSYAQHIGNDNIPEDDILQSLRWNITTPLADTTKTLSFSVIRDLIKHPVIEVQRLGAAILVARKDKPSDIPEDVFLALIESEDPEIRAAGVNLLGNMKDSELAEMTELLASLLVSTDKPVRIQAQQIIQRIAKSNNSFNAEVLPLLIDEAFKAEPDEGVHDQMVECITHDLESAWKTVDKDQLWRLLMAQSRTAQRVGAVILQPRPYREYTVKQWARLGKHLSQTTRQWARDAYTNNVSKVRDDLTSGLRLLDTGWLDTRSFALEYFRENMTERDWTEDHFVFLCDSTRDDVQRLGRDLLREFFKEEQGESYLLKLSQHPTRNVQLFASEFLQNHAAGKPVVIRELNQYFITVLSSVNQARVAKDRVLSFLLAEARKDKAVAEQVSELLDRQSVTVAIQDKAGLIQAMLSLKQQYPDIKLPLTATPLPIRGTQQEVM